MVENCWLMNAYGEHRLDDGDEALTGTYVSLMLHGGKFFNCSLNRPLCFTFCVFELNLVVNWCTFTQRRLIDAKGSVIVNVILSVLEL